MAYCSKCGKEIDYGSVYCPSCGAAVSGSSSNQNNNQQNWTNNYGPSNAPQQSAQGLGGTLTIILVLGILWAIVSLLAGVALIALGVGFIFIAGPVVGAVCLLGGIITLLSCMYIYKLENHKNAFILCLIGSIIALLTGGILVGIIGIIFAFLLNNEKYRFKS
ncbi:MAG: zinc ribbon domain-containing protein [Methanomassiliicoccaceae archaeon]|nr:zinc ribbon domain-containing protein [Methanomassiliicoccaceae archaeon]